MILQCYAHPGYHCDGIDRPTGVVYHEIPDEYVEKVKKEAEESELLEPPCLALIHLELAKAGNG